MKKAALRTAGTAALGIAFAAAAAGSASAAAPAPAPMGLGTTPAVGMLPDTAGAGALTQPVTRALGTLAPTAGTLAQGLGSPRVIPGTGLQRSAQQHQRAVGQPGKSSPLGSAGLPQALSGNSMSTPLGNLLGRTLLGGLQQGGGALPSGLGG